MLMLGLNDTVAFGESSAPGSSRLTFGKCSFEAQRYFSCTIADPKIEAWLKTKPGVPQGVAFTEFLKTYLEGHGCTYAVVNEAFRINGIFFSFDTREFSNVECPGQPQELVFKPDKATAFSMIDFWYEDRW